MMLMNIKMEKPKNQRCYYKGNGCERTDINDSVLIHMCEGTMFFKCHEYCRLQEQHEQQNDYSRRFVE